MTPLYTEAVQATKAVRSMLYNNWYDWEMLIKAQMEVRFPQVEFIDCHQVRETIYPTSEEYQFSSDGLPPENFGLPTTFYMKNLEV